MKISPGAMLGLLGGGQLGRMFTMSAQSLGYRVTVLDPGESSPAGTVADRHLQADYLDPVALAELAASCAGVTTEFENVPAEALALLERSCVVSPHAESVAVAQDRIREKQFLAGNGFAVAPFAVVRNADDLAAASPELFPGILKVARFGYDGKGQFRIASREEAHAAWRKLKQEPCVLERMIPLASEVSVVVARGFDGAVATFPVAENHHARGILDLTIVPARVPEAVARQAREDAVTLAQRFNYQGVLCVEFFVTEAGALLVNEIAPRPHNSGHYTIDACVTSQFEQQVRVLCGLPLGNTAAHCTAVMVNLLGEVWQRGEPAWEKALAHSNVKLHLYGKREPRPGRKMGHYTVLAPSRDEALALARQIKQ